MERAALLFYRGCSKGEKETKGGAAAAFACSRPPPPPPPPPPPAPAANLAKRRWLSQKGEENDFFSPFSQPVAACFSFTLPLKQNVDAIVVLNRRTRMRGKVSKPPMLAHCNSNRERDRRETREREKKSLRSSNSRRLQLSASRFLFHSTLTADAVDDIPELSL